jgi:ketosteroid isomerase-like protein
MSDTQANKRITAQLFEHLSAGENDTALAMLSDDSTWWLAGTPGKLPVAGTLNKAQVTKLFRNITGALQGPIAMTVKHMVAEGDDVAAEVESLGHLKNGRTYNQHYHFRFTIRGGKIVAVREYLDTLHVQEVWSQAS